MTTGATGQLGLALPVQGELSGTWGDTVNNGLTQYTNIAIAGTLTLTNDGAVTLSNTTGDASASNITSTLTGAGTVTAQFAIVRVTGTLTVAKVVTGPAYSKTYTVVNAATGGIVTFKAAGQTGVSVAVGESAFVYFNGTDYVKLAGTVAVASFQTSLSGLTPSTATTGAVTLAGTLGVASGGTGLTAGTSGGILGYTATGTLASSVALTANALVLGAGAGATPTPMASLGTTTTVLHGNASGAPTFGAVSLTADVTGVLPTANGGTNLGGATPFTSGGVVYASSTSALATGSGLQFNGTNLGVGVTPTSRLTTSGPTGTSNGLTIVDVDYSNDTHQIYGNNSLHISSGTGGAGAILFKPAGTETLRLTSTSLYTASGINVGIGTSSPSCALDVTKAAGANFVATFQNTTAATPYCVFIKDAASSTAGYPLLAVTNSTGTSTYFRVDSSNGNVGIGTSSPAYKLHAVKTGGGIVGRFDNADGVADIYGYGLEVTRSIAYIKGSGALHLGSAAGYSAVVLDSAGNLGLGVTPSAWSGSFKALQVGDRSAIVSVSNSTILSSNYFNDGTADKYMLSAAASLYQQIGGDHRWLIAPSGTAGNAISFTQAMTLSAAGYLGIGETSPPVGVSIKGATADAVTLQLNQTASSGHDYKITSRDDGSFKINDDTAAANRLNISSAGIFTMPAYGAGTATFSAAGVISSVSDETWKRKDGVPINPDVMLQKLEPGYWFYNDEKKEAFGSERHLGFYAQNVNVAIGPEAAPEPEEGKPWGYYDRSVLAVTVMSLQKALLTIESLKARLDAANL